MCEFVFKNFVTRVNKHQDRCLGSVCTYVVSKSLIVAKSVVGLGDREYKFPSVFICSFGKNNFSLIRCIIFIGEKEESRVSLLEDPLDGSVVEGHDDRERIFINKSFQVRNIEFISKIVSFFIKLLIHDNMEI